MKLLTLPFILLFSLPAIAGEVGNGGGVHYCPEKSSVEFYDLFEGKKRYGYNFPVTTLDYNTQMVSALDRIGRRYPSLQTKLADIIDELFFLRRIRFLSNIVLTPVRDANILIRDEDCTYEQLANWDKISRNVLIDADYYELMSERDKAALLIHEALYKIARDDHYHVNSDLVRRSVAEIFSDEPVLNSFEWYGEDEVTIADRGPTPVLDVEYSPGQIVLSQHLGNVNFYDLESFAARVSLKFPKIIEFRKHYNRIRVEYATLSDDYSRCMQIENNCSHIQNELEIKLSELEKRTKTYNILQDSFLKQGQISVTFNEGPEVINFYANLQGIDPGLLLFEGHVFIEVNSQAYVNNISGSLYSESRIKNLRFELTHSPY